MMHHLTDSNGFENSEINLLRPFTLLIGPNGSGKSNVIEAIELLSFVARGQPLHEIGDVGRAPSGLQIRGGLQACGRGERSAFTLGFTADANVQGGSKPVDYKLDLSTNPNPQILEERLSFDDREIYNALQTNPGSASRDLTVRYDNFARGGRKPQTPASSERSVLSQYRDIARKNRRFEFCTWLVDVLMGHLQASFVFDPDPKLMHAYERIGNA
ncbi:MAG: AAA family ATPase, partial [Gemmatimonadetes bacterium]|nr:AAA family ATPase [Gemmatimonadota bacterium]